MGRERPILFSSEMVRALLSGAKTQTRRVVKPHPVERTMRNESGPDTSVFGFGRCPYGVPGDRLWVRETFRNYQMSVAYQADGRCGAVGMDGTYCDHGWILGAAGRNGRNGATYDESKYGMRWRHSIHMPRWASRLTLEVVSVKVERVAEISHDDAIAEGVTEQPHGGGEGEPIMYSTGEFHSTDPVEAYALLWNSINAERGHGWEKNPWCWCLTFRVLR